MLWIPQYVQHYDNIVIEHIEERAIATAPHQLGQRFRFVDDSRTCLLKNHVLYFMVDRPKYTVHACNIEKEA